MTAEVRTIISAEDRASPVLQAATSSVRAFTVVAGAAATTLASLTAAMVAGTAKMVKEADDLNDVSKRLGIGVEQLASYRLIAEQSGTSVKTLGVGLKALSLAAATHGEAFKKAGIDTKDANKALYQTADLIASMPDGMEKSALATKLFKGAGAELIPMLNEGSKGLEESARKSAEYARQMAILAPNADAMNDNLAAMNISVMALQANLANRMVPGMVDITSAMALAAQESGVLMALWVGFGGVADKVFGEIGSLITSNFLNPWKAAFLGVAASMNEFDAEVARFIGQNERAAKSGQRAAEQWKRIAELGAIPAAASAPAATAVRSEAVVSDMESRVKDLLKALTRQDKQPRDSLADREVQALESLQLQLIGSTERFSEFDKVVEKVTNGAWKNFSAETKASALAMAGQIDEQKQLTAETQAYGRALEQHIATLDRETSALEEKAARAEYENSIIGITTEQMALLVAQRYDEQIALQEAELAQARSTESREADVMYIERQIAALERLKSAEVTRPKLQAQAAEWNRFTNQIEQSLTDSLYRAFESGKDFGEAFADSLEATFKSMVLKYAVQVVVNETGSILGIQTSSGGSSYGSLSNLYSAGSGLYSAYAGYTAGTGTGVMGSIGNWAGGLGGYGGWGASTASAYGTTVGSQQTAMLAAQDAGLGGSAAGGSSGSWMSSLGWIAAIAAGMYMSSNAWKEGYRVGNYDPTEKQRDGYDYPISNFFKKAYDVDKLLFGDKFADSQLRAIITGDSLHFKMQESIWGSRTYKPTGKMFLAGAFGEDYEGGSSSSLGQQYKKSGGWFHSDKKKTIWESTADTELDNLLDNIHGAVVATFSTLAESVGDTGSAAAAERFVYSFNRRLSGNFEADISALTDDFSTALARSLIPSFDAMRLKGESTSQEFIRLSAELAAVSQASMLLGKNLTGNLGDLIKLSDALISGFGGMSAFNTAFQAYYEAFYSQPERLARSTEVMVEQFARLGLAMPATKEGLRAMIEGLDLTTESGRALFTALINLSPAFAQVMDANAAAAANLAAEIAEQQAQIREAWQSTADSIADTIRALRGEMVSPAAGYAAAQSQFTIATAMARAGDQDAADRLPELASAVVMLGKSVTATAAEQTLLTARTIATLQSTMLTLESQYGVEIPHFAGGGLHGGGLRWVGERGPELEATGPARIYNFDQMREMMSGASMAAELRELRAELRRMREDNSTENRAVVGSTAKLVRLFERVMPDGDSLSVRTAA